MDDDIVHEIEDTPVVDAESTSEPIVIPSINARGIEEGEDEVL